jgi:hypothetical protein
MEASFPLKVAISKARTLTTPWWIFSAVRPANSDHRRSCLEHWAECCNLRMRENWCPVPLSATLPWQCSGYGQSLASLMLESAQDKLVCCPLPERTSSSLFADTCYLSEHSLSVHPIAVEDGQLLVLTNILGVPARLSRPLTWSKEGQEKWASCLRAHRGKTQ